MDERIAGHALVECLKAHGVETAYGVPGESYLAVLDGLHGSGIRFVNTRHESGASFMAAAFGKLTGRPGVAMVTRGPGATNASIGVHTAMQDSSPMVLFVGQIDSRHRGREAFQEIDYRAFFGGIAKWVCEIDHANRVPELVTRAFEAATSGRPGPVVVSLPEDVLKESTSARVRVPPFRAGHVAAEELIAEAERLLRESERPLVIAGGAWSERGRRKLKAFCEANALPVTVGFRSQDLIDNASPSYVGDAGIGKADHLRDLIEGTDLVIALGIRFGEILTDGYTILTDGWFAERGAKLIHAHAGEAEIGKIVVPDVPLHGDLDATLDAWLEASVPDPDRFRVRTERAHAAWEAALDAPPTDLPLDMGAVMRHLRDVLPDDVILTNGAGNFSTWSNRHFAYGKDARLLAPQSGSMGYGVPAAVMAKIAHPGRTVVCFAGDGDFQMTGMEMATGVAEGAAPIVLVLNNGSYGTIWMHQERDYPGRVSGTALANPDFAALGRAIGCHGERVDRTEDFAAAFERALASPTGAVLDLIVPGLIGPGRVVAT